MPDDIGTTPEKFLVMFDSTAQFAAVQGILLGTYFFNMLNTLHPITAAMLAREGDLNPFGKDTVSEDVRTWVTENWWPK